MRRRDDVQDTALWFQCGYILMYSVQLQEVGIRYFDLVSVGGGSIDLEETSICLWARDILDD